MQASPDPHAVAAAMRRGIEALAAHGDLASRVGLASSRSTPADVLAILAADGSTPVQEAVAANPGAPAEALRALARSRGWPLKAAVARNPGALPALLEELAESPSVQVRAALAGNPAAPDHVRALLALDHAEAVREAVRGAAGVGRPEAPTPPSLDGSDCAALVRAWVDHGWLPDGEVLLTLVSGPAERLPLASVLVRDPRLGARAVADAGVAELTREGPRWTGPSAFGRVLTRRQAQRGLDPGMDQPPGVRAACGLLAGSDALEQALTSLDPAIRMGAAANRLVTSQLSSLIEDPDSDVAEVATARFEMAMGRLGG